MKAFSYSIIKKTNLHALRQQLALYQSQITSATLFVKAIEQGNLDIQYNTIDEAGGIIKNRAKDAKLLLGRCNHCAGER